MIPKVIHCFWAGGQKTALAERCLASWRRFAPGWEVREWNLANLPDAARQSTFCAGAIRFKRWAFVSDWVRFWSLHEYGGVYFDFDQELLKSIDELPEGEWCAGERRVGGFVGMAPGAGLRLMPRSPIARTMLDYYAKVAFSECLTVGEIMDNFAGEAEQSLKALLVLDPELMSPMGMDGKLHLTGRTVGVHWYAMSWASPARKIARWLSWHGLRKVVDGILVMKRMLGK